MLAKGILPACGAMLVLIGSATASERSAQLIESFNDFCTMEAPSFMRLDERASSMKLPGRNELALPHSGNYFSHSKSWLVFLSSGPHELSGSEAQVPDGKITSCGIGAPDVDGDEMRTLLTTSLNLDAPISVRPSPDGEQQVTTWKLSRSGNDFVLILTDSTPTLRSGISLILVHREFKKS
jgi:hypothetical protein